MADSTKVIDLVINAKGNAPFNLTEMRKETKQLNEEVEKLGRAFDAVAEAKKRLEREGQARQVDREYDRLRGPQAVFDPHALAQKLHEREGQAAQVREHYERLRAPQATFDYSGAARQQVENEAHRAKMKAAYENLTQGPGEALSANAQPAAAKGPNLLSAFGLPPQAAEALGGGAGPMVGGVPVLGVVTAIINGLKAGAAAVEKFGAMVNKVSDAINIINNEMLSEGQKARQVSDWATLGAQSTGRKFGQAAGGATELWAHNERKTAEFEAGYRAETRGLRRAAGISFEADTAAGLERSLARRDAPEQLPAARGTFREEIEYQEAAARMPARDQQRKARAEEQAAAATDARARHDVDRASKTLGEAESKRNKLTAAGEAIDRGEGIGKDREGDRRFNILETGRAELEVTRAKGLLEDAINRKKETGVSLAEKESGVRKANITLAQADLAVLEQQVQRRATAAQGAGRLLPFQQAATAQAVHRYLAQGYEGTSPWDHEAVRGQFPGLVGKDEERRGEAFNKKEYSGDELKKLGIEKELEPGRREEAEKGVQIRAAFELDERQFAKVMKGVLKELNDSIVKLTKIEVEQAKQDIRREFRKQNQGG